MIVSVVRLRSSTERIELRQYYHTNHRSSDPAKKPFRAPAGAGEIKTERYSLTPRYFGPECFRLFRLDRAAGRDSDNKTR